MGSDGSRALEYSTRRDAEFSNGNDNARRGRGTRCLSDHSRGGSAWSHSSRGRSDAVWQEFIVRSRIG
jgi:hypothetical protein